MIEHLSRFVLPAAYALLPPPMESPAATAFLLAVALQESDAEHRRQVNGSARGFWQFERNGVRAILTHVRSEPHLTRATKALCYFPTTERIHQVIEHNDTLAAICARLLLWTLPVALPTRDEAVMAWGQYQAAWQPGKPRHETWNDNFSAGWELVDPPRPHPVETP
jgi:hypothetical protein